MSDEAPEPTPERPRFLLPDGCKDLIDVLRRSERVEREIANLPFNLPEPGANVPLSVTLPPRIRVVDLAALLHVNPVRLLQALLQMNMLVLLESELDFETAAAICRGHGILVSKAP
jgi:hypothetical protein